MTYVTDGYLLIRPLRSESFTTLNAPVGFLTTY